MSASFVASLLLIVRPGTPFVASLLLVVRPVAPFRAALLLVVRPGAPFVASLLLVVRPEAPFVASLLLVVMYDNDRIQEPVGQGGIPRRAGFSLAGRVAAGFCGPHVAHVPFKGLVLLGMDLIRT